MKSLISFKAVLLVLSLGVIVCTSTIIFFLTRDISVLQSAQGFSPAGISLPLGIRISGTSTALLSSSTPVREVRKALPIRLIIRKINVDANLEYVGLTSAGAMDVPKGPAHPAWYDRGVRPGESGSAVIAGHYGWKDNIPAVFDNLSRLHKGDKLYVVDEKGTTTTFIVSKLLTYGEHQDASDVFESNDGRSHLNLITCQGVWNKNKKSYASRLVVFTDKEEKK